MAKRKVPVKREDQPAEHAESSAKDKGWPVRLSAEAIKWARIASGYTGESMNAYVSRIVSERAAEDAKRSHAKLFDGK